MSAWPLLWDSRVLGPPWRRPWPPVGLNARSIWPDGEERGQDAVETVKSATKKIYCPADVHTGIRVRCR